METEIWDIPRWSTPRYRDSRIIKKTTTRSGRTRRKAKSFYRRPARLRRGRDRFYSRRVAYKPSVQVPVLTAEERAYVDTVTNPFGHYSGQSSYNAYRGGRICDESGIPTFPAKYHCDLTFAGSTGTSFVAKICKPAKDNALGIRVCYSNGGVKPTGAIDVNWVEGTAIAAMIRKYRVVGMGLKVICVSGSENEVGTLRAGNSEVITQVAVDNWNNYADFAGEMEEEKIAVKDGITVRYTPMDTSGYAFVDLVNATAWHEDEWRAPTINCAGLSTNTTVLIQAILHLEIYCGGRETPFSVTASPISTRWPLLVSLVTHPEFAPVVTVGHSFKSFFTGMGRFVKRVANWIVNKAPVITKIASTVASAL